MNRPLYIGALVASILLAQAGQAQAQSAAPAKAQSAAPAKALPALSAPVPGAAAASAPVAGASRALNDANGLPQVNHGAVVPELKELPGVTSWKLLAKAKTTQKDKRFVTEFAPEVLALNAKDIKLQGFMMPLGPSEAQNHFLLTLTPQSCLFCLPAGPEGMVEVKTKKPIKITFDPIVVSGRFESLKDDKNGLLYRLTEASLSK